MRCKNCGFENEEGRYICENCGSPLYDENEEISENGDGYLDPDGEDDAENRKITNKSIAIIIALAVILVALVAGIVFAVTHTGGDEENTPDETESISIEADETTTRKQTTTERTTTTTTERTTESTTERTTATTEKTTESTTVERYYVSVDIDGNGSVSGDGEYESGKKAVLVATADADSQFIGWYDNDTGKVIASGNKYTITVKKNYNITAKFERVTTASTPEEEVQP